MTRYKLDIPEMINKKDAWHIFNLAKYLDQEYIDQSDIAEYYEENNREIPLEWLTEIKEEPWREYFDETYKYCSKGKKTDGFYLDIKEAFQAGEQNNELRHRETVSSKEAFNHYKTNTNRIAEYGDWFNCWQACKESHNLK